MSLPFDLSVGLGIWLGAALLGAAFVRGYSGFGFSAIFIAFASLLTNPLPLIPAVFMCEIAMTGVQARGIRGQIDWRLCLTMLAGAAVALPLAVAVMVRFNEDMARAAVSTVIFCLSLILWSGWRFSRPIGRVGQAVVGVFSGMANGAGVGGLPVAAFMAAQPIPAAVFRATMIVYLTGIDLMSLPWMAWNGLVTGQTFVAAALAFPILWLGVWLGGRRFGSANPQEFRKMAVMLLIALSAVGLLRAVI